MTQQKNKTMKTLTKITVFITTMIIVLLSTTSCFVDGLSGIRGSRNVVSEDRDISSNFETIKVNPHEKNFGLAGILVGLLRSYH